MKDEILSILKNNKVLTVILALAPFITVALYYFIKWLKRDRAPSGAVDVQITVDNPISEIDDVGDQIIYTYEHPETHLQQNTELIRQKAIQLYNYLYSNASDFTEYLFGNENGVSADYNITEICEFIKSFQSLYGSGGVTVLCDVFKQLYSYSPRKYMLKMLSSEDYNTANSAMSRYASSWI